MTPSVGAAVSVIKGQAAVWLGVRRLRRERLPARLCSRGLPAAYDLSAQFMALGKLTCTTS